MLKRRRSTAAPVLSWTLTLIPSMMTVAMVGVGIGVGVAERGAAAGVEGAGAEWSARRPEAMSASTARVARMAACPLHEAGTCSHLSRAF